eukprot:TRINITY_DN23846_c0_g1_i1.p1 TRINITY_DN23846_c0_g1~~TRINITY_DN23846_c0_g1_i1.p1  ORF type:complete len:1042 (+),score=156.18 TRINITY_DN23846_c0_g1_i1:75-3128(+)
MAAGLQHPTITSSGELFILNGSTGGELQPMPFFLNKNFRVLAANLDRAYVATEPPVWVSTQEGSQPPTSVYCFMADDMEPSYCQEFESIQDPIRQIAVGSHHILVLTYEGTLYSRGTAVYGSTGHGGSRDVPEFAPLPALQGKKVKFVAAGPNYSIAITAEGDVYSWGRAFSGETGLFSQVEAVPRFAPQVTPFKVIEVSCGHGHVLARTELQQCISWGENTCGQLGIGQKSKPTYKPQLLDVIPSQVVSVSAGWAHSVVVGLDGRAYSWGLNSHGQLGLGDTATRMAPHLLHHIIDVHEVEKCHAARAFTLFQTTAHSALICGQIPRDATKSNMDFAPHRPGKHDPEGCVLAPVQLNLSSGDAFGKSYAQLSDIVAFDRGAIGFARSTVYKVTPNVSPITGGTKCRAFVTGIPFEKVPALKSQSFSMSSSLVQETIPVQVRLKSAAPNCDMTVKGYIVDKDIVEFTTPNALPSPLGAVVEQGATLPLQIRVSIDGGFTWTEDRYVAPKAKELDKTLQLHPGEQPVRSGYGLASGPKDIRKSLHEFKTDFEVRRGANTMAAHGATMLWFCKWPDGGPTHVEPGCAPVAGGTEIVVFVPLPARMPTENLTVKFVCTPLQHLENSDLEATAPMRRDAAEIINPDKEALSKLALAGSLEIPVIAFLDPAGRGVCCVSPPMDADCVNFYTYSIQVSLDGLNYLSRSLHFQVFDLRVTGLEPSLGPLVETSEVKIKTTGFVKSEILKVRLDFPKDLQWASRTLPARYDHTNGEVSFIMPELEAEVRQRTLEAQAALAELAQAAGRADAPEGDGDGADPAQAPVDPDGGLAGLEVFVELSLNGQNFTEDRIRFNYHGTIEPDVVSMVARPPGEEEAPKEEAPAKGKKGAKEEVVEPGLVAGCKLGSAVKGLPPASVTASAPAAIRAEMVSGEGEAAEVLKVLTLDAKVELITPPSATPGGEDAPPEVEMVTALVPVIRGEDVPEGVPVFLRNFEVSLNGQSFTACPAQNPMRLEPQPREAPDG